MNKKIVCLIAIAVAIIIGISIGIINNSNKIENGKSTENFAKMNEVENNVISTNKIPEQVNNVVDNENTTTIDETNNSIKDTNTTNSSEDKTNNSKPVTSKDVKETPKENTASSVLKETTPDLSGQVSVVPYVMSEDEIKEVNSGNSHTFIGTVTNINDVAVIIKPDEGYDGVSGNQITLVKSEYGAGLNVNDRVEITFTGQVTKTYPGNIHVVAIKKI
ncbi:MAG TPA: hypothetical protein DEP51_01560 [Clostridiales bacterium]|nr:hypothetical protein [Clostridiales bacterium]